MSSCRKITHVIFDLDGLLLDTETIYSKVYTAITGAHGKPYTEELRQKIMGTTEPRSAEIVIAELDLPISPEELLQEQFRQLESLLPQSDLLPGAEKLIKHLYDHKIPMAVATSSSKKSVDLKLSNHQDLFKLFRHIVAGSSDPRVQQGKPSPDIFLVCASDFDDNPKPEQCLVFEDSTNGVLAAIAANMQVVHVPEVECHNATTSQATVVINSLEEFKPEQFGLPGFR